MKNIKLAGGLGDIVHRLHTRKILEIADDANIKIHIYSDNPFAQDIFLCLKCEVFSLPHCEESKSEIEFFEPEIRNCYEPLTFCNYTFPKNRIVGDLPYIVVAPHSAVSFKDIPANVLSIIEECLPFGGIQVGANYTLPNGEKHIETPIKSFHNLIDQLSPAGVYELVKHSTGVISCHTSVQMMAWFLKKPCLTYIPSHFAATEVRKQLDLDKDAYGFNQEFSRQIFSADSDSTTKSVIQAWLQSLPR